MLSNAPNFAFIPNVFVGGNFAPIVSVRYSLIYLIPMLFGAELRLRQVLNAVHDRRHSRHRSSTQDLLHSWARTLSDASTEAFRTPWTVGGRPDYLEHCSRTKTFIVLSIYVLRISFYEMEGFWAADFKIVAGYKLHSPLEAWHIHSCYPVRRTTQQAPTCAASPYLSRIKLWQP